MFCFVCGVFSFVCGVFTRYICFVLFVVSSLLFAVFYICFVLFKTLHMFCFVCGVFSFVCGVFIRYICFVLFVVSSLLFVVCSDITCVFEQTTNSAAQMRPNHITRMTTYVLCCLRCGSVFFWVFRRSF